MSIATMLKQTALAAVAAAAMLPMAAQAQTAAAAQPFEEKFADLIQAAKAEGELTWYHASLEEAGRQFAQEFQDKFGIKVNHTFLIGSPGLERFRSEAQSNNNIADIFNTTDGTLMLQAMSGGLISDYRTDSFDAFPQGWVLQSNGGTAYPTARTQMTIAYNTQTVTPEEANLLTSWNGLLDPIFAGGRLSLADLTRVGSVFSTYLYLLRENAAEYGQPYLTKLAAQQPIIYASQTEEASRIAAGETDIGIVVDVSAIQQYNKGAPIAFHYPEPTAATLQFTAISANAPHPNAAKLFLEYITSKEGMAEWGKLWGGTTGRPDVDQIIDRKYVSEPWFKPETSTFVIQDWAAATTDHDAILSEWSDAFRQ